MISSNPLLSRYPWGIEVRQNLAQGAVETPTTFPSILKKALDPPFLRAQVVPFPVFSAAFFL